jgi:hypothetical protein
MTLTRLSLTIFAINFLLACQNNADKPATQTSRKDTNTNKTEYVNPYAAVDVSPMDMCYYPGDYPLQKMSDKVSKPPVARVIYSRPHLQGRKMFGNTLKYGQTWRLGANEATEMQLFQDVSIQGKPITAGRYIIYCIPFEDKWTIVFNSNIDSWGLRLNPVKDIARFDVPVTTTQRSLEYFTMIFEKTDEGASLIMAWDNVMAKLPLEFTY